MTDARARWIVVAAIGLGCPAEEQAPPADGSTGGSTGSATTQIFEPPPADDTASSGSGSDSEGGSGEDGLMGECSIWMQDCAAGDKCVPWSAEDDLIPDDIRCCPEVENPALPGEECVVQEYFGSCLDDCALGSFCMDIDGDGTGVCQAFCQGDASAPMCEPDETCLFYFAGVPICFPKCDPLVQDCTTEGWGCYPDEEAAGGTGFICLPTIIGSTYGGYCWLLSSCAPGLICVTSEFHPECDGQVGCCTPLCDIDEADTCADFHPDLECVSWYFAGQTPPSADLQDVGACVIPP